MDAPIPDPFAAIALPWWLDVITLTPLILAVFALVYFWRYGSTGATYIKKQSDYLDHQKSVNYKVVAQNKAFEDMIARQYSETNERSDRALAQSDEALRLHSAALDQLTRMNETLARVALKLEAGGGSA